MLTFAAPGFLLAGALAMLVPLALHLIRRRPPGRAPLPTARFLVEDPRNAVRVSRPSDLVLLALRMLLLLLAGAAFSRPSSLPAPQGTSTVVLLDRGGAVDAAGWRSGLSTARQVLLGPEGEARGELVLFDTGAVHVPRTRLRPALFDSLLAAGPARVPSDYAAALRAIPAAARALRGADSVRVRMISAFPQGGWSPGMAPLRESAWPGAIEITGLPMASDTAAAGSTSSRRAYVVAGEGGRFVGAALGALGYDVQLLPEASLVSPPDTMVADAGTYFVLTSPSQPAAVALFARVRRGATLVVGATAVPDSGDWMLMMPWDGAFSARPNSGGGTMWFGAHLRIGGAAARVVGSAMSSARTVAAWDDGRPAAVALGSVRGCVVYVGTALEGGELPFQAEYPAALGRLARGCVEGSGGGAADRPLDSGALQVLRGRGPVSIAANRIGAAGSIPFGRWLIMAALAVALVETFLAYRRRAPR